MIKQWTSVIGVMCIVGVAVVRAENDPLSGRWRLDTAKSTASSPMPKAETQVFEISGTTEHGVTEITGADGNVRKTEYTAGHNDGKWHPVNDPTGKPTGGNVMVVKIDDRTSWWFSKRATGNPYMALRVVAEDGKSFVWTSLSTDGKVTGSYLFARE